MMLEVKDLSVSYGNSVILDKVSFSVERGQWLMIVGPNGAGKTTLTNLLLRLYDVTDGKITVGGEDIRDVTVESHRDRFSAVFQDFQLFACNTGENVALSDSFDEERVKEALGNSGFNKKLKKRFIRPRHCR